MNFLIDFVATFLPYGSMLHNINVKLLRQLIILCGHTTRLRKVISEIYETHKNQAAIMH